MKYKLIEKEMKFEIRSIKVSKIKSTTIQLSKTKIHQIKSKQDKLNQFLKTSMHSSRMRTARLLPISPGMHCSGGCLLPGGVCSWGCLLPGVSALGGGGGVCSQEGVCIPACTEADTLPVNRMTDRQG